MRKFSRSVLFLTVAMWSAAIHAAAFNEATYQLRISQVKSPNGFLEIVKNVGDSQQFFETGGSPPSPAQISGNEQTPVATSGLGFAQGNTFASASAGILKAAVLAETQAVAQPTTNVGGAAFARAVATDLLAEFRTD